MSSLRPLFRFDPGWLFTVAGLVIMVASALLPAQLDVAILKEQLARLEQEEKVNEKRLHAYEQFLGELKKNDPALLTRLAASQLNLMPKGEAPVLMATSMEHTVSDWIEATVPPEAFEPNFVPDTLLTRLASGQRRLWLMGGGALIMFIGLTTGIPTTPSQKLIPTPLEVEWLTLAQRSDSSAGDECGELVNDDEIDLQHMSSHENVSEDVADIETHKWNWDAVNYPEPCIFLSHAECANSIVSAVEIATNSNDEDIWPRAAD